MVYNLNKEKIALVIQNEGNIIVYKLEDETIINTYKIFKSSILNSFNTINLLNYEYNQFKKFHKTVLKLDEKMVPNIIDGLNKNDLFAQKIANKIFKSIRIKYENSDIYIEIPRRKINKNAMNKLNEMLSLYDIKIV